MKSKQRNLLPKYIPGLEVVDSNHWMKLCFEYKDLFEEPGTTVERGMKHQIDLLDSNAPLKYYNLYRISQVKLDEFKI